MLFRSPLEGLLIERLGPRRMVAIGLPILGAGFIFLSQTSELWHLYASFGIMSFGAALGGWLPMMTVMNHWFVRKKTRAMAVVMEGFAVGGIGIPFLLAWCIGGVDPNISERFGWSTTALGVGVTIIVFALPLAWLVRNRPEEVGLRPDGDKDDGSEDLTEIGRAHSELQSQAYLVCRLLLEKKKKPKKIKKKIILFFLIT